MRIFAKFYFKDDTEAVATTGVAGDVTDFILPSVGDLVWHHDSTGIPIMGKVTERVYIYRLAEGVDVDGSVQVTLMLDRVPIH